MTIEKKVPTTGKKLIWQKCPPNIFGQNKKTVGQKKVSTKRYDHREVVARPKIIRGDQADFFKKMKKKFFSWKLLIIIQDDEK